MMNSKWTPNKLLIQHPSVECVLLEKFLFYDLQLVTYVDTTFIHRDFMLRKWGNQMKPVASCLCSATVNHSNWRMEIIYYYLPARFLYRKFTHVYKIRWTWAFPFFHWKTAGTLVPMWKFFKFRFFFLLYIISICCNELLKSIPCTLFLTEWSEKCSSMCCSHSTQASNTAGRYLITMPKIL